MTSGSHDISSLDGSLPFFSRHFATPEFVQKTALFQIFCEAVVVGLDGLTAHAGPRLTRVFNGLGHSGCRYRQATIDELLRVGIVSGLECVLVLERQDLS